MKIGIVGLGLIGGSFAKAFSQSGHDVFAYDIKDNILESAKLNGIISEMLTRENISDCDLIIIALYPKETIKYIYMHAEFFSDDAIIIDCCGIKRAVCNEVFKITDKYNFKFIGGHPMAGLENSGFEYSRADIFKNSTMVLVPKDLNNILDLQRVKELLLPVGFGNFIITTAEQHDKIIAMTSQLTHLIANAYIASPTIIEKNIFYANSFKDMTRVASLNSQMWTELFIKNHDYLANELDLFIKRLVDYKNALKNSDESALNKLFETGNKYKKELDNI